MNIPVAHIGGGDRVIGNVDDQIRHAVTKLAHLHFTTNADSAKRILRMGEQEFRVLDVGNPGLDRLLQVPHLTLEETSQRLGFAMPEDKTLLLVIQHVISTEIDDAYRQMFVTLEAVADLGLTAVLSYPNSDAGGQQMIRAIREFEHLPHLHVFKNIPRLEFVNLMRHADCLLGNSSAGILEAPLLKLPAVNVGNRQKGRLHAENVQFVPHDLKIIKAAVNKACFDQDYISLLQKCENPYGDGSSSIRIANALASTVIDTSLLIKDIAY
jgi:GDP/UDP-N,N'-diacetylbacillosamine 2-epimerase (hydrolysing)